MGDIAKPETPVKRGMVALGSLMGALAASSCCILPLVLISLGVSGAWVGKLAVLAPYQPLFLAATVLLLWMGFRMVRHTQHSCDDGTCARPLPQRAMKFSLIAAAGLTVAAIGIDLLGWITS